MPTAEEIQRAHADLVAMNDANAEPWWRSGVGVFGSGGVLWALGFIFEQISAHGLDIGGYDLRTMIMALGTLAGFVGVLYRRYMPGLKPMFHSFMPPPPPPPPPPELPPGTR